MRIGGTSNQNRITVGLCKKCAIYISHRLSSTRFTDKIAVFQDGHIAEYGSHDELMALSQGVYSSMFNMQAQYYV